MNAIEPIYLPLIHKYGENKAVALIIAHKSFLQAYKGFEEAKSKKLGFEKALSSMKMTEKRLNSVIPFITGSKNIKNTILGLAGLYEHFEEQILKASTLINMFEGDHEGPRNLFIFLLASAIKKESGTDWLKVYEIILDLKESCAVTAKVFDNIKSTKSETSLHSQKELLRSASNRAKKYKFLKNSVNP